MIITAREYVHCNTQNTIEVVDELVRDYWDICPLRELYWIMEANSVHIG
jgi:putative transposase